MPAAGKIHAIALASVLVLTACKGVPDHVIAPDDMAALMADIHTAEAAIDMNFRDYASDSSRKVVKQAVLERHNVTQEQMDTSLVWYGAHLTKYMDVYDRAEEILQERIDKNSAVAARLASLSVSGDSVDVWNDSRRYMFTPRSSAHALTFNFQADQNWQPGDTYVWRAKYLSDPGQSQWGIATEYTDGTVEVNATFFRNTGWQELAFVTDSTRTAKKIYGYIFTDVDRTRPVIIDSVQMIRKRLNPAEYQRRYRQRHYKF